MANSGRRHPRIPADEPASIERGEQVYDGKVADISESGAAIDFVLPKGESKLRFDVGDQVNVDSETLHHREGRVVRHYDGGFALNFDGFRIDKDDG